MSRSFARPLAVQHARILRALAARVEEENSPLPPELAAPLVAELAGADGPADLCEAEVLALLASAAEADRGELVPLEGVLPA